MLGKAGKGSEKQQQKKEGRPPSQQPVWAGLAGWQLAGEVALIAFDVSAGGRPHLTQALQNWQNPTTNKGSTLKSRLKKGAGIVHPALKAHG